MAFVKHVTDTSNVLSKHVTNIKIVIVKHETTLEKYLTNMEYGTRLTRERYSPKYQKGVLVIHVSSIRIAFTRYVIIIENTHTTRIMY